MRRRIFYICLGFSVVGWLGLLAVVLVACQGKVNLSALNAPAQTPVEDLGVAPFIPPTLAARVEQPAALVEQAPTEAPRLQPTPACVDNLLYIEDVTIPDGTVVKPGEQMDKRWQVENNGTCNWDKRYRLKLVAGPAMGVPEEQALYPARSGARALIRMRLSAPQEPGTYRSAWQAYDPQGQPFGDPFFIEVVVQ